MSEPIETDPPRGDDTRVVFTGLSVNESTDNAVVWSLVSHGRRIWPIDKCSNEEDGGSYYQIPHPSCDLEQAQTNDATQ